MNKLTPKQAGLCQGFSRCCNRCKYFQPKINGCERVEGYIDGKMDCEYWSKKF